MAKRTPLVLVVWILVTLLCPLYALQEVSCQSPQKKVYLSFNSLSKRDTIHQVFQAANREIIAYDFIWKKTQNLTYNISKLTPRIDYNEHHQVQSFVNDYTAKVSLGSMEYSFRMDYQVLEKGTVVKMGWALGRAYLDQGYFTKRLTSQNGSIEWDPYEVPNLTLSTQIPIDYSEPKLSQDDQKEFELMLNDHVGNRTIKQSMLSSFNIHFQGNLKTHLNYQHMFATTNVTYYWRGTYITYMSPQKGIKLQNNGSMQGLQGGFLLQIIDYPQSCTELPQMLDPKKYGGIQQLISMSTINATFMYALQRNMFNPVLSTAWQISQFQFRMGDLANVCPQAAKQPAAQFFYTTCTYDINNTENKPRIVEHGVDSYRVEIPYKCIIRNTQEVIIQIKFVAQFFIKIVQVPMNDFLISVIDNAAAWNIKFAAIDSQKKYVVTNELLAGEYIRLILESTKKTQVLGTNWRTQFRRFPSVEVTKDYLAIFDVSEQ